MSLVASSVAPVSAIDIDRYGKSHVTLQDMTDAANAQFRADAANWQRRLRENAARNDTGESNCSRILREMKEQEAAERSSARAADARKVREQAEAKQRAAEDERRWREEAARNARAIENGKQIFREQAAREFESRNGAMLRTSRAFLSALRAGSPFPKERGVEVPYALLTGSFKGATLAEIGLTCTAQERYAVGMEILRQRDLGETDYDSWVPTAAYVLNEQTWQLIAECSDRDRLYVGGDDEVYDSHWAPLVAALVYPKARLDQRQRKAAIAMLAEVINSVPTTQSSDDLAKACLLVAAARKVPELARLDRLQKVIIPQVQASIWVHGFPVFPAATEGNAIPESTALGKGPWLELAMKLILASNYSAAGHQSHPSSWFMSLRRLRRSEGLAAASDSTRKFLQLALEGCCDRLQASSYLRQALQADFDFALTADTAVLNAPDLVRWDEALWNGSVEYMRKPEGSMKVLCGQSPAGSGVAGFLFQSGPKVMSDYLAFVCGEPAKPTANMAEVMRLKSKAEKEKYWRELERDPIEIMNFRAWYALHQLTTPFINAGKPLSALGIAKERWNDLVIVGETAGRLGDRDWSEPATVAKLVQVRREILGESAAELLRPKYSTQPATLRRTLRSLTQQSSGTLSTEYRKAVESLLAVAQDVVDPATVLTIAQIRGPMLGDWAKLGTWLDDPRRRPKDDKDPLYALFIVAIVERDMVAGSLTSIPFGPRADAEACQQFHDWLVDVLAATGAARKKLIDEHFPSVIYCPDAASAYPDLRMVGYDIDRGGFASRALLLLSSEEFNPEWLILNGYATIEGEDGKEQRIGGPDLEPWLAAVAKLPRTVTPEVLLAELSDAVKARRAYLAAKATALATPSPEAAPRELTEEEARALILKEERADKDRRTRWVADGCQDALVRLANRWSPSRESAQAELLALGDKVLLDDEGKVKANPICIAARFAWEQAKMKGMDDASAFAAATSELPNEILKTLATLAQVTTRTQPLLLWHDEHFTREAVAAMASCP
ncbi:MAG: hypothetical protein IPP19_03720 [Verrucomicrobia bacterium]|nr:hypothetical protein [Verrucomicrobiota bacterium]